MIGSSLVPRRWWGSVGSVVGPIVWSGVRCEFRAWWAPLLSLLDLLRLLAPGALSDVEYDMLVLVVGGFVERVKSRLFLFSYCLTIRRSCKFRSSSSGHNMRSE